jgi:hypothetical protein
VLEQAAATHEGVTDFLLDTKAAHMRKQRMSACTSTRSERVLRGIVALIMAAFAVSMLPTDPIPGVAASVVALGIAASAITGGCPRNWLGSLQAKQEPAALGFDDARDAVTLTTTPHRRP